MSSIFHHASTQTHAQTASPQPLSMSGQLSAISLDSSLLWGPSQASRDWTESNMKRGHRKDCKNKTSDCWSLYCLIDWSHDGEGDYVNKCVSGPQGELGL